MVVKIEQNSFVQKCVCGHIIRHQYSSLEINGKFIILPVCEGCNKSIEILHLNSKNDEHSKKVTQIFAEVATQG